MNHFYTLLNSQVLWKDTYNIKLVSALISRRTKREGETPAWTLNSTMRHTDGCGNEQDDIHGFMILKNGKSAVFGFKNLSNNSKPISALSKSMCLQLQTVQVLNISFSMYRIIHFIYRVKGKRKVLCRNEVKAIHSNFTINVNCLSSRSENDSA